MPRSASPALVLLAALAGCATTSAPPPRLAAPSPQPAPELRPTTPPAGLERVIGQDAGAVTALFGPPELDLPEGPARKLQFRGPFCVLDVYFYPREGGTPAATHIDARTPAGADLDRASCIAALSRRAAAR